MCSSYANIKFVSLANPNEFIEVKLIDSTSYKKSIYSLLMMCKPFIISVKYVLKWHFFFTAELIAFCVSAMLCPADKCSCRNKTLPKILE